MVTPVRRVLFNPTLSGTAFTLPGLLGMICLFLTVFITAIALVRERETGTLEQLLVTPVTSTEVVLGKILPFGVVAMGAVIVCIAAGWLLFGLLPVGSTLLLLAVTPIFLLIGLAQGLLISSLARSSVDAVERSVLTMVPQMMLSDFLFPLRPHESAVSHDRGDLSLDPLYTRDPWYLSEGARIRRTLARNCDSVCVPRTLRHWSLTHH